MYVYNYRPLIVQLEMCPCVWTTTFELSYLWCSCLACWFTLTLSESYLKVKVMGQSSQPATRWKLFLFWLWMSVTGDIFYGWRQQRDIFLVICRFLCAIVVDAKWSEGSLVWCCYCIYCFVSLYVFYSNNNNNNRFTAFVRDYRGEPVPEETLTHPPSWSSPNLYQLLPSTTIHSILPVQIACLAIFLHNLCPCPLWSTSWSGDLHLIFHEYLYVF